MAACELAGIESRGDSQDGGCESNEGSGDFNRLDLVVDSTEHTKTIVFIINYHFAFHMIN
jgi:hypothetical protein